MQEYKYTYQDWVEGNIPDFRFFKLLLGKEMSNDDLNKIATEQNEAFLHYLDIAFEALKLDFLDGYNDSLLKDEHLNYNIRGYKLMLDTIKSKHEIIVTSALNPLYDGRFELTKSEVDTYLPTTLEDSTLENFVHHFANDFEDGGIKFEEEEKACFKYILRSNFYNWLVWFKGQQDLVKLEPNFKINPAKLPKEITDLFDTKQVSYTWLSNNAELTELFQCLLDAKLIHLDTKKEQFEAVFTAQPLHIIKAQPIKWYDDNASELLYFILQLEGADEMYPDGWLIEKESRANYKRLTACFAKPNGSQFTENFKQAKQNLKQDSLAPSKKMAIDNIINQFI